MSSVNKVILIGNLGADPDVRTTGSGQTVATLSIATSERWTDGQGERKERTEWHRVIVWGKLAELAQRYLQKGRKVFVEGKIQTRSWEDQNTGEKRYSTEVVANELVFLDSGDSGGQSQDRGQSHDRGQGHDRAPAHDRGHGNPSQGRHTQQARPAQSSQGQSSQGQRRQSSPPPSDETFDGNVPF